MENKLFLAIEGLSSSPACGRGLASTLAPQVPLRRVRAGRPRMWARVLVWRAVHECGHECSNGNAAVVRFLHRGCLAKLAPKKLSVLSLRAFFAKQSRICPLLRLLGQRKPLSIRTKNVLLAVTLIRVSSSQNDVQTPWSYS